MRCRNSSTGKYEKIRVGQAICGRRFSEITIYPYDYNDINGSSVEIKRSMDWLQHVLTTRLDINK